MRFTVKMAFLCLFLSLCLPTYAQLSPTKLATMENAVQKIAAPHMDKVGVYFWDLSTGQSFGINENKKFPTASVGKVPVMATAYYLSDKGLLDLGKKVKFTESDKLEGSGVLRWMTAGKEYTLWNLIRLMIVLSDNTATKLSVENVGLTEIANFLEQVGLTNIIIVDKTMLKEAPAVDINLSTPKDMAMLVKLIKNPRFYKPQSSKDMLGFMKKQRYRWGIWRGVPPRVVVADKTGNLDGILNDVGVVYTKAGNYVLALFTCNFTQKSEARKIINRISAVVYQNYCNDPPFTPLNTLSKSKKKHPSPARHKISSRKRKPPSQHRS